MEANLAQSYPGLFGAYEARPEDQPKDQPKTKTGGDLLAKSDYAFWPTFEEVAKAIPESPAKANLVRLREMIQRHPVRVVKYPNPGMEGRWLIRLEYATGWREEQPELWQRARALLFYGPDPCAVMILDYFEFGLPRPGTRGRI